MGLIAKGGGGGDYELIPEDNHLARCVQIIDIGTQEGGEYGPKHQIVIGWELPGEMRVYDEAIGEQPAMMSKFYTLSLADRANLRHDLESWRGRAFTAEELEGFDLKNLLGVPCLLQVIHKTGKDGKTRAQVGTISKLPKGMECPPQISKHRLFDLEDPDMSMYAELPEWLQARIRAAAEWSDSMAEISDEEQLAF